MITTLEARPPYMRERNRFEHEMSSLQIFSDRQIAAVKKTADPTIGFEFDLNYGLNAGVFEALKAQMPAGMVFPAEHSKLTTHEGRAVDGKLADGFTVKLDGPRLEISAVPLKISDDAEFARLTTNVIAFGKELQDAKKITDRQISVPGIDGHPTRFEHPKTAIAKLPLVIHAVGKSDKLRFPPNMILTASPQATIALPLARVGVLIDAIANSRLRAGAVALTGPRSARLGLRSDLALIARRRVMASRKRKIGTVLLDGTTVDEKDYSPALTGLVTLIVMYLLTSVIVDRRDAAKETYAKGSLPINVKTPFWQIYNSALNDREKTLFRQLYGNSGVRLELYKLANPRATASAGSNRLFPPHTHGDIDRFHTSPLSWDNLVDHVVSGSPLTVTKANTVKKPNHAVGDEILFAPLSSKIDFTKTDPLIAVELRRIGFEPVRLGVWKKLMEQLRALAMRLNS